MHKQLFRVCANPAGNHPACGTFRIRSRCCLCARARPFDADERSEGTCVVSTILPIESYRDRESCRSIFPIGARINQRAAFDLSLRSRATESP